MSWTGLVNRASGTGVAEPAEERRVADAALASGVDLQFQKPVGGEWAGVDEGAAEPTRPSRFGGEVKCSWLLAVAH
jgi:hypothetical protein